MSSILDQIAEDARRVTDWARSHADSVEATAARFRDTRLHDVLDSAQLAPEDEAIVESLIRRLDRTGDARIVGPVGIDAEPDDQPAPGSPAQPVDAASLAAGHG